MRSDNSTHPHGMPSRSSSSATTGSYGGCWCIGYHPECAERGSTIARPRRSGSARGALTPRSSSTRTAPPRAGASTAARRSSRASSTSASTTRTRHRGRTGGSPASSWTGGIAARASPGRAWRARSTRSPVLGGGLVEAIPEVTAGREAQGRFLFSATVELFEQYGFTRGRQVGKHAWIVSRAVEPV